MNFNIIRRISDPMIKILCRRVSTHDIFNDNEEEAIAINETEKVEGQSQLTDHPVEAPIEIDETDDEEDKVSRIIIDDTDEDEVAHLLTDPFAKDRLYTPVVIDETDEEVDKVSHTVINDTDEDEIYKAVGKDNVRQKVIVEPIKKKRCPKLIFFKLAKQLEKIVSKIEKLELISCDLESGITTDFDNCVMLRLQAVEVSYHHLFFTSLVSTNI